VLKRSAFPNRFSFAVLPEPTVEGGANSLFDAVHDQIKFLEEGGSADNLLTKYGDYGPLHFLNFQNDKYGWFLRDGLKKAFEDISPIKDSTGKLSLYLTFDPENSESIGPAKHTEAECVERALTYQCPIFVEAEFRNEETGEN
jgi:hypothetical protein